MAWKKAPEWLVETFGKLVPDDPRVEPRKMFGYPCAFANDNMFIGLHEENMVMRLPDADRERFKAEEHAEIFSPFPGRMMREYVVVPHEMLRHRLADVERWIGRSLAYAASLPPKAKNGKAKGKSKKSDRHPLAETH
ncbi:MAG TPA: TfoX/Sxy family protein [Thermoanaerobaculia bacterium]|nr:TfoX/Sxy family protein [Thermoanaerobaculia bacterium]